MARTTTKMCTACTKTKPLDDFHRMSRSSDGHKFKCKACMKIESKEKYASRSEARKLLDQQQALARVARRRALIEPRLVEGCVDCGEDDPIVLEFDHVRGVKEENISRLLRSGSEERLRAELEKCDVVCANCHRKRTSVQFNWFGWMGDIDG